MLQVAVPPLATHVLVAMGSALMRIFRHQTTSKSQNLSTPWTDFQRDGQATWCHCCASGWVDFLLRNIFKFNLYSSKFLELGVLLSKTKTVFKLFLLLSKVRKGHQLDLND